MKQDVIFAIRQFGRRPGTFAAAILGLALAIGVSTAVFSLVNAEAFRGYGIGNASSIFKIALTDTESLAKTGGTFVQGNWAYSDFDRLHGLGSLDPVACLPTYMKPDDSTGDVPETAGRLGGVAVSGDYFRVMQSRAAVGRSLDERDDSFSAPPVVELSYAYWRIRFDGDPEVVGQTLWLDRKPFTIVGIAARGFTGPPLSGSPPSYWIPLKATALASRQTFQSEQSAVSESNAGWNPAVFVFGRLHTGTTQRGVTAELTATVMSLNPRSSARSQAAVSLLPLHSSISDSALVRTVSIALASATLVVVLACVNVTNILLAFMGSRTREIGTRMALGATRVRLGRQILTESLLLTLVAGSLGFCIAVGLIPVIASLIALPPFLDVEPDIAVFVFVSCVTVLVGVIAGLIPLNYATRGNAVEALKDSPRLGAGASRLRFARAGFLGCQAAASVVLLTAAAMFLHSLVNAKTSQLGFDPRGIIDVSVDFGRSYDASKAQRLWEVATDDLQQFHGLKTGLTITPPFGTASALQELHNGQLVLRHETSATYFDVLGLRVIRGRAYSAEEVRQGAPVAVISAALAKEFWADGNPIGSDLDRVWGSPTAADSKAVTRRPVGTKIIGVVTNTVTTFQPYTQNAIYIPLASWFVPHAHLLALAKDDPASSIAHIRDVLKTLDPQLQARGSPLSVGLERELQTPESITVLAVGVGVLGLVLAVQGIAGVAAYSISSRRREISVRLSVGGTPAGILRMLIWDTLRPVVLGLAVGMMASPLIGRVIQASLLGVSSYDPLSIVLSAGILVAATVGATYLPARRAGKADPVAALKEV